MKTFIVILALALSACGDGCDPEASVAPVNDGAIGSAIGAASGAINGSTISAVAGAVVSATADSATKEAK
jgi:hypothetical protein